MASAATLDFLKPCRMEGVQVWIGLQITLVNSSTVQQMMCFLPSINVKTKEMSTLPKLGDVSGLDVTAGYQRAPDEEQRLATVSDIETNCKQFQKRGSLR